MKKAVDGCSGVLTSLVPYGTNGLATRTTKAILDTAPSDARLIFACGTHVSLDKKDEYSVFFKSAMFLARWGLWALRVIDLSDTENACDMIFASKRKWTVARGAWLEEGDSEGCGFS